jgi:hypothetical protein
MSRRQQKTQEIIRKLRKLPETALNKTLLPSESKEVNTGLQYLHSSKSRRSSPTR